MTTSDGHEREILNEQRSLLFSFYSFGVMLRKQGGELTREYRADPAQMALARTLTNLISGNTVLSRQDGLNKKISEDRLLQKQALSA